MSGSIISAFRPELVVDKARFDAAGFPGGYCFLQVVVRIVEVFDRAAVVVDDFFDLANPVGDGGRLVPRRVSRDDWDLPLQLVLPKEIRKYQTKNGRAPALKSQQENRFIRGIPWFQITV